MRIISEGMSLARLPFTAPPGLRILIYHSIGSPVYGDQLGLNTISELRFRQHIDIFADMLVKPLFPIEISREKLQISITFDDGYKDNLYVVAPILVKKKIPFTVFITSDFIRNKVNGFLLPEELRKLASIPGVTIGSHGRSHCHLTDCSEWELHREMSDSKHYLEDLIGQPVTSISYPYGDVDIRVRDATQEAGYEIGTCSRFDINRPGRDKLLLNRCVILCDDTPRLLHQKLRGDWDWFRWRKPDPILIRPQEIS